MICCSHFHGEQSRAEVDKGIFFSWSVLAFQKGRKKTDKQKERETRNEFAVKKVWLEMVQDTKTALISGGYDAVVT